jgi:acetylornithine deacetylase/succinyl-diaminopimelate desuccinylase-like protein
MKTDSSKSCEVLKQEVIDLMRDLIQIKSPYFEEDEIISFVNGWFHQNHMDSYLHEYEDEKVTKFKGKNVILQLQGSGPGPYICLNGHLDTVKLCNGWTVDPYEGYIRDGNIYGVGALDMKSGCCAIMLAVKHFTENHEDFKGKLLVTLVSDEEGPYGLGTNALIEDGLLDDVDFSVVGEPGSAFTEKPFPTVCLGARGGYGLEIEIFGRSAHAAVPENGLNAAVDAAKVVCELKNIRRAADPLLGHGELCVVGIEGDGGACSVPDYAKIKLFQHIVRDENEATILEELNDAVKSAGIECRFSINFRAAPSEGSRGFLPYTVSDENEYVKGFFQSVEEVCGEKPNVGYFQSIGDFNYLGSRLNAPVVIFGADGKQMHGSDEHASIDSIVKVTETIYHFLVKTLSDHRAGE